MKIEKVHIKNFRILKDIEVDFEDALSVVIGKNNAGKTSSLAILEKFLASSRPGFSFDDFSISEQQAICALEDTEKPVAEYTEASLSLKLYISYTDNDDISKASEFLLDLDVGKKYFVLLMEYVLTFEKYQKLVADFKEYKKTVTGRNFHDFISHSVSRYFSVRPRALEYGNEKNCKDISLETIAQVISIETISARRDVDNEQGKSKSLSALANKYYKCIDSKAVYPGLEQQLLETDKKLTNEYKTIFADVVGEIKEMSYGPSEAEIAIISSLVDRFDMQNNTIVKYLHDETFLPEDYNGLGYLNLFAIMFDIRIKLDRLSKKNNSDERPSPINLLFIEEPEAHTHPQMQYVFIMNIKSVLRKQIEETPGFSLQTAISTHSTHIVSQCDFQDIKYFYRVVGETNSVKSRSLKRLESAMVTTTITATDDNGKEEQEKQKAEEEAAFRFVKQYVTLHRAEMFFADKAILIEGDTERMLISAMMKKYDESKKTDTNYMPLLSQNISVIEVGAYAKVFSTFLGFIGVKTVIFTDLDCAKKNANNRLASCCFTDATATTNATIKHFLGTDSISDIVVKTPDERTFEYDAATKAWVPSNCGHLRLCFQSKDNEYQPSSFEDAFLCRNMKFVVDNKAAFQGLQNADELIESATDYYCLADRCIKSKTTFALDILMNGGADNEKWTIPNYIEEGLRWLSM
jgi:predicted ATP-dependent endonuclease of OLD family